MLSLFGVLMAQNYAASQFHGVANCSRRGARMAIHEGLISAGLVSGAVLGGVAYDYLGHVGLYITLATVAAIGGIVQWRLVARIPVGPDAVQQSV